MENVSKEAQFCAYEWGVLNSVLQHTVSSIDGHFYVVLQDGLQSWENVMEFMFARQLLSWAH